MTASQIIFYCIAAFILGTAVLSVTTTKIFRAAIWLLASLIGVAALYFWLEVEFIAAVQIVDQYGFNAGTAPFDWSMEKIGNQMLGTGEQGFALPFEVVSMLLLAAMIGCIVIALKAPADTVQETE